MVDKLNIKAEKEKVVANISSFVIYFLFALLFSLSIIFTDLLFAATRDAKLLWAVITITISLLEWSTAVLGFYSYIFAFKYDTKKSIIFVAVCYILLIIGILSFYLVIKIMP